MSEGSSTPSTNSAQTLPAEFPNKIAEFKDYILSCAWLEGGSIGLCSSNVVRREQNDREINIRVILKLLDDGPAAACLLVQNDSFHSEPFHETRQ